MLIWGVLFTLNAWLFIDAHEGDRPSRKLMMAMTAAGMAMNLAGMMH